MPFHVVEQIGFIKTIGTFASPPLIKISKTSPKDLITT
jgi:hypothetical protein